MSSTHAEIFGPFLGIYDVSHPTVESQNFTRMHQICSAAIPQLLAFLQATNLSHFGANGAQTATKHPGKEKKRPPKRPMATGGTPAYCWTHGTSYHSSTACRNKATGHQDKASATKKMGGKESVLGDITNLYAFLSILSTCKDNLADFVVTPNLSLNHPSSN